MRIKEIISKETGIDHPHGRLRAAGCCAKLKVIFGLSIIVSHKFTFLDYYTFFFEIHLPLKGNQESSALGQTDYNTVSSLINYQGF